MARLEGKVAIITEPTSGMEDFQRNFRKKGAKVVVGRKERKSGEVIDAIKAKGGEAI